MSYTITREGFLLDTQGAAFRDVANDPAQPFELLLDFFNDPDRQRRMAESEIHHDRAPLAGVVREMESEGHLAINRYFEGIHPRHTKRLRRAVDVLVRMVMERLGWQKTGSKSFLGVRAEWIFGSPRHNLRGLSFWFLHGERYELQRGMPFRSVAERGAELQWMLNQAEMGARPPRVKEFEDQAIDVAAFRQPSPRRGQGATS